MSIFPFENWQMAAIIAEGRDVGEPAPVVYVSGEEVSLLLLIIAFSFKAWLCHAVFIFQLYNSIHHMFSFYFLFFFIYKNNNFFY